MEMFTPFSKFSVRQTPNLQHLFSLFVLTFHFFYLYINPVTADGQIVARRENPAVSTELLTEILSRINEGATETDIICYLRQ